MNKNAQSGIVFTQKHKIWLQRKKRYNHIHIYASMKTAFMQSTFIKQAWKHVGHIQLLSSCQWIIFIYLSMKTVFMQVSHTHIQPWKLSSCQWAALVYNHESSLHTSKSFRNKHGYCIHDSISFMEKPSWQASHSQTLGPCLHASKSFVNLH